MLDYINSHYLSLFVIFFLFAGGIFFMFRLRFFALRHPRLLLRPFFRKETKTSGGKNSPRRALWLALGGVLGVGNIVGVSSAIFYGGAGAVLWMCASAVLSATLKYAETVLALSCRRSDGSGSSTSDYIRRALTEVSLPRLGNILATVFACLCLCNSLSMGCVIQINALASSFESVLGIDGLFVGLASAILIMIVASGGMRRISGVVSSIVPFMTLLFATLSVAVIIIRHEALPTVISEIFRDAFDFSSADSVLGGVGGFFLSRSVRLGVSRGLLSNEGGAGTSPMAHSTSSSDNAVEQGFLGIAEVLIDTLILCTLTAIVILISYPSVKVWGENSVMMTLGAYSSVLGAWVEPLMCVLVSLFALATVFTQTYYGMSCLRSITKSKTALRALTLAYSLAAIVGSCAPPHSVWGLADFSIGIMTVINVSVLLIEQKTIAKLTADYFASE